MNVNKLQSNSNFFICQSHFQEDQTGFSVNFSLFGAYQLENSIQGSNKAFKVFMVQ